MIRAIDMVIENIADMVAKIIVIACSMAINRIIDNIREECRKVVVSVRRNNWEEVGEQWECLEQGHSPISRWIV